MEKTVSKNGNAGLLTSKFVEIVKFDPRKAPHYCISCGVSDELTSISQRGYCKHCEFVMDMNYYNLYVY